MSEIVYNTRNWKIKTNEGFVDFVGVARMGVKQLYQIDFTDNTYVRVTSTHRFFTLDHREIQTRELTLGLELLGIPNKIVENITKINQEQTYDIIESKNHCYITNGILSHNCEFLSSDALLISSLFLAGENEKMNSIRPLRVVKDVILFDEIKFGGTYLVGVDPATGSGNDYSTIVAYEFPSLIQVAEYRSNTMSTNVLYGVLKNFLLYLEKQKTMVYFSVENNGVGEGVIALYEADESPPDNAEFISEEGKNRRGMTTTSRVKMRACVNLKEMYEKYDLQIKSKILFAELKTYVRSKGAYEAQRGATDDCISATLIVIRLVEEVATYDQEAFDKLYSGNFEQWDAEDWDGYDSYDENDEGLPVIV